MGEWCVFAWESTGLACCCVSNANITLRRFFLLIFFFFWGGRGGCAPVLFSTSQCVFKMASKFMSSRTSSEIDVPNLASVSV